MKAEEFVHLEPVLEVNVICPLSVPGCRLWDTMTIAAAIGIFSTEDDMVRKPMWLPLSNSV